MQISILKWNPFYSLTWPKKKKKINKYVSNSTSKNSNARYTVFMLCCINRKKAINDFQLNHPLTGVPILKRRCYLRNLVACGEKLGLEKLFGGISQNYLGISLEISLKMFLNKLYLIKLRKKLFSHKATKLCLYHP